MPDQPHTSRSELVDLGWASGDSAMSLAAGTSISATGSHWLRGWKAYRADSSPEGTVPGRIVLVTHWEAING